MLKLGEIFPNLVKAIWNIIETVEDGISAYSQHRDEVSHVGVTAPFLATALQRQYNISISVYAVRHLFLPPKTSTLEASEHKRLLPMRLYSPKQDEHGIRESVFPCQKVSFSSPRDAQRHTAFLSLYWPVQKKVTKHFDLQHQALNFACCVDP